MEAPPSPMSAWALIDHATALGLRVAQIADNLPLHEYSPQDLSSLRDHAQGKAVEIEVGTRGIGEDHMLRYLELARHFGSPILRAVIDSPGDHPSPEQVVERLRPLMAQFQTAGVVL